MNDFLVDIDFDNMLNTMRVIFSEKEESATTILDYNFSTALFVDKIEDDLICGICKDVLNEPINLPCPHIFCQKCLSKNKENKCPICRLNYTDSPLMLNSYVNQMVCNLKVKCIFYEKGCTWTGIIGNNKRHLLKHIEECSINRDIICTYCQQKIKIFSQSQHDLSCMMMPEKCKYCQLETTRGKFFIHMFMGTLFSRYCENMEKCIHRQCNDKIPVGNMVQHLQTECSYDINSCTFCEIPHSMITKYFKSHLLSLLGEEKITITDIIAKFSLNLLQTGDLVRYLGKLFRLKKIMFNTCELENVLVSDDIQLVPVVNLEPVKIMYNSEESHDLNRNVMSCYNHYECTAGIYSKNKYTYQPFFICKTCSPRKDFRMDIVGCCLVCAIECHKGHELYLDQEVNKNFCDCGTNNMTDLKGNVVNCIANKAINIESVDFLTLRIRSNGEVEVVYTDDIPRESES